MSFRIRVARFSRRVKQKIPLRWTYPVNPLTHRIEGAPEYLGDSQIEPYCRPVKCGSFAKRQIFIQPTVRSRVASSIKESEHTAQRGGLSPVKTDSIPMQSQLIRIDSRF